MPEKAPTWGIDPHRRNRLAVRALLRTVALRPAAGPRRRLQRLARDGLALALSSDFRCADFGPGLYLPHPWGIVVHARVTLGTRCTIYQHVTIGEDNARPGVPQVGDDVVIGAGAAILGPVTIGHGARIGANAVVVTDVPAGCTAVGVPARIVGNPGTAASTG